MRYSCRAATRAASVWGRGAFMDPAGDGVHGFSRSEWCCLRATGHEGFSHSPCCRDLQLTRSRG
jgi:hypothetical protein